MSKVIHLRLSNEAIYTCLTVLKASNVNITNLPLATIVRRYIEGSTDNYRLQKQISIPDNIDSVLSDMAEEKRSDIDMESVGFIELGGGGFDQDKMENIMRAMQTVADAGTAPVVQRQEVEEEAYVLPPPPWEALHVYPFDKIVGIAPKDVLVEKIVETRDQVLQRAVQCVYSDIPTQEWGTEQTVKLVERIIPTIQLYFQSDE